MAVPVLFSPPKGDSHAARCRDIDSHAADGRDLQGRREVGLCQLPTGSGQEKIPLHPPLLPHPHPSLEGRGWRGRGETTAAVSFPILQATSNLVAAQDALVKATRESEMFGQFLTDDLASQLTDAKKVRVRKRYRYLNPSSLSSPSPSKRGGGEGEDGWRWRYLSLTPKVGAEATDKFYTHLKLFCEKFDPLLANLQMETRLLVSQATAREKEKMKLKEGCCQIMVVPALFSKVGACNTLVCMTCTS